MKTRRFFAPFTFLLFCAACGSSGGDGGGGSGNLTAEQQFAQDSAEAATITARRIVSSQQTAFLPIAAVMDNPSPHEIIRDRIVARLDYRPDGQDLPLGPVEMESFSEAGDCGGTYSGVSTVTTPDDPEQFYPLTVQSDGTLDGFCLGVSSYTITYNGTFDLDFNYASETSFSISIRYDLTYTTDIAGIPSSGRINTSESCEFDLAADVENCSYGTSYTSSDDTEYVVNEVEVSGDQSVGYNISGTIEDNDGNVYQMVATGITLCPNGNLQTGNITLTVNGSEVIDITVSNCNEYVVMYQGQSRVVAQPEDS